MSERRTDPHRPGAIVPADYRYLFSFSLATTMDGWPIPSFRVNCELDGRHEVDGKVANGEHGDSGECCCVGVASRHAHTGREHGPGKCSVCGAAYIYGDCWLHESTGTVIFLGHDCADKYALMADRSEWELEHGRAREAAARQIAKREKAEQREAFLADNPGLEDALAAADLDAPEHVSRAREILDDLRAKFRRYGDMSPKQVALAMRLAEQVTNPPEPEQYTNAPTGKGVNFTGVVVSKKVYESDWGSSVKITVKVETDDGVWLAWGTCPRAILDAQWEAARVDGCVHAEDTPDLKGSTVTLTATLKQGRDEHFAIMSRPRGKVVSWPDGWTPPEAREVSEPDPSEDPLAGFGGAA